MSIGSSFLSFVAIVVTYNLYTFILVTFCFMNYAIEASFISYFTSNGRSISFFRAVFLTSTFFDWFFRVLFSKQPIFMHYSIPFDSITSHPNWSQCNYWIGSMQVNAKNINATAADSMQYLHAYPTSTSSSFPSFYRRYPSICQSQQSIVRIVLSFSI